MDRTRLYSRLLRKFLTAFASIAIFGGLLFLGIRSFHPARAWMPDPDPARALTALSSYALHEALTDLEKTAPAEGANIVPFCLTVDRSGALHFVDACAAFYMAYPKHERCALQNLNRSDWDAEILSVDPKKILGPLKEMMAKVGCHRLLLDFESIHEKDRDQFSSWVRKFSDELHRNDPAFRLSIAVHAKTNDAGSWEGAAAQDWGKLCGSSDELILMTYDYHFPGVTKPGEAAPIDWVKKVLEYAVKKCTRDHLRVGLAAYGYDWKTKAILTEREAVRDGKSPDENFIETTERRREKSTLAESMGISRTFLWAAGMARPKK